MNYSAAGMTFKLSVEHVSPKTPENIKKRAKELYYLYMEMCKEINQEVGKDGNTELY